MIFGGWSCSGSESPLSIWLSWISRMHEGDVLCSRACAAIASRQVFSSISLQGPFSVRLLDCSPLRVGGVRVGNMDEGRVRVSSSSPAVIASGQEVIVTSPKSNLLSNSDQLPFGHRSDARLNNSRIWISTTAIAAEAQVSSVIGLNSSCSQFR